MSADQVVAAINDWMFKMRQASPQERTRMIQELVDANQNVAASSQAAGAPVPSGSPQDLGRSAEVVVQGG